MVRDQRMPVRTTTGHAPQTNQPLNPPRRTQHVRRVGLPFPLPPPWVGLIAAKLTHCPARAWRNARSNNDHRIRDLVLDPPTGRTDQHERIADLNLGKAQAAVTEIGNANAPATANPPDDDVARPRRVTRHVPISRELCGYRKGC
jgi:hypothetical protein